MTSGPARGPADPGGTPQVPDEVALDRPFRSGELHSVRAAVAAHAYSLGAQPESVEILVIVASELATNAILHGGGIGRLLLWRSDSSLVLRVRDEGAGLADPDRAGTRRQDPAALGGRGLWIARQLCDRVAIASGSGGTEVTVVVPLVAPATTPAAPA